MIRRLLGVFVGLSTLVIMFFGMFLFIPDMFRYLRMKSM